MGNRRKQRACEDKALTGKRRVCEDRAFNGKHGAREDRTLTGERRRIPIWTLPYMGWGVSIASLTLLSSAGNFQTNRIFGGTVGDWVTVTLVEAALTAVGIALAWIAFAKQRSRVHASQAEGMKAVYLPKRAYIYWLIWFIGVFILNVIADTAYIAGLGVDIQGVGPGWVVFIEGW